MEKEEISLNSFYEGSITLKSKPSKVITRRKIEKPVPYINIYSRILHKILAYQAHHDQVKFIPGMCG